VKWFFGGYGGFGFIFVGCGSCFLYGSLFALDCGCGCFFVVGVEWGFV